MLFWLSVIFLTLFISAEAHPQLGIKTDIPCSEHPPAQSYHIHVLFWGHNKNSTNAAVKLEDDFLQYFNLTRESNICPFAPGDVQPEAPMCVFPINYEPSGPFVTAQTALFIPVSQYQSAVSWIVPRRGVLDVFVHPNSGCSPNDHLHDALWAGKVWELDPSIFFD